MLQFAPVCTIKPGCAKRSHRSRGARRNVPKCAKMCPSVPSTLNVQNEPTARRALATTAVANAWSGDGRIDCLPVARGAGAAPADAKRSHRFGRIIRMLNLTITLLLALGGNLPATSPATPDVPSDYELTFTTPVDPALQEKLVAIDARL